MVLGPAVTVGHALYGVVIAAAIGEALFQGYAELPFATSYEGGRFLRSGMAPFMVTALVAGIALAAIERMALESAPAFGLVTASILLVVAALRRRDRHTTEKPGARRFDEQHQPMIRLDLSQ
jgi:hypothetical protein